MSKECIHFLGHSVCIYIYIYIYIYILTRVLLKMFFNVISHHIFYFPRGRDFVYADWPPNSTNVDNTLQPVSFAVVNIYITSINHRLHNYDILPFICVILK